MRRHEALHQFEPFCQLLADLFALGRAHRFLKPFVEFVELNLTQEPFHRFRAHAGNEIFAVLFLRFAIFDLVQKLRFLQRRLARINDDVVFVINDAFKLARAHVEHQADARRHAFVKPNVRNRNGQFDMAHAFATHSRQGYFHATAIADYALVLDPLVFSARTFPIAGWTEDAFAEKSALFRFESSIIDRLRVFDFAFAPRPHRVARGDANCDLVETDRPLFAH